MGWPILSLVTFLPLVGAGFIMTARGEEAVVAQNARNIALSTTLIVFALSLLLWVEFDPTTAGAATGQLTVTSTSSTNGTAVVTLAGTGTTTTYAVDLSWDAPSSSPDPVASYDIYRAPSGGSVYQLVNSSVNTTTAFVDSTVQNGLSYDYYVESVSTSGMESVPSNIFSVTVN